MVEGATKAQDIRHAEFASHLITEKLGAKADGVVTVTRINGELEISVELHEPEPDPE